MLNRGRRFEARAVALRLIVDALLDVLDRGVQLLDEVRRHPAVDEPLPQRSHTIGPEPERRRFKRACGDPRMHRSTADVTWFVTG